MGRERVQLGIGCRIGALGAFCHRRLILCIIAFIVASIFAFVLAGVFIEVIRRYVASRGADETGWLAGLRDSAVGRALTMLHENPAESWTLDTLALRIGMSRSVLAERFARLVGHPPMQYLTYWRMQLAARQLSDGRKKISAIGRDVGYESEAAFSRTFKRVAGISPAAWRAQRSNG